MRKMTNLITRLYDVIAEPGPLEPIYENRGTIIIIVSCVIAVLIALLILFLVNKKRSE